MKRTNQSHHSGKTSNTNMPECLWETMWTYQRFLGDCQRLNSSCMWGEGKGLLPDGTVSDDFCVKRIWLLPSRRRVENSAKMYGMTQLSAKKKGWWIWHLKNGPSLIVGLLYENIKNSKKKKSLSRAMTRYPIPVPLSSSHMALWKLLNFSETQS